MTVASNGSIECRISTNDEYTLELSLLDDLIVCFGLLSWPIDDAAGSLWMDGCYTPEVG